MARSVRFYGFSHSEVMGMKSEDFQTYLMALPVLRAEESLRAMNESAYPHTKADARRKMHKATWKQAHVYDDLPKVNADLFFGPKKVKSDGE